MKNNINHNFPISFRRGGSRNEYGIWFHFVPDHRDLLIDPGQICRCLDFTETIDGITTILHGSNESHLEQFLPFIRDEDPDAPSTPFVDCSFDWNTHTMIWTISIYTEDDRVITNYRFDQLSICTKVADCIAALYDRSVIRGAGTAYGSDLTCAKMGQIMTDMLSLAHRGCREIAVPLVQDEDFSLSFKETDAESSRGSENLLEVTVQIGSRSHTFCADRYCFDFRRLRHDLENFIYHGEAHLEILDDEDMKYVVINAQRRYVLDETIPVTAGSNNRSVPYLFVTVDECQFDEKESIIVGFCDMIPALTNIYEVLSDVACYYGKRNDARKGDKKIIRPEEFMSKDFVDYLLSERKKLADEAQETRKHYAYVGMADDNSAGTFRNSSPDLDILFETDEPTEE